MTTLRIDVETYSSVDLLKSGVHKYVESPDFEILLFAYAFGDDPVHVIDLTKYGVPTAILYALQDPNVIKTAFNAAFERTTIAKHFGIECDARQWRCTAVHALTLGLPGGLDNVAKVLGLDAQKDAAGKALIKYFSTPCKPTKVNGGRTRNLPEHAPDKWEQYKAYCRQDVVVEREVARKLERFPVPQHEWDLWALDQRINDRGVRLDPVLVKAAQELDELYDARLVEEAKDITGLSNPNSNTQLRAWFAEQGLETPDGLAKEQVNELLAGDIASDIRRMLEIRQEMGKTSVDKFNAMARCICGDERARGLLQFCGANRTWRWAGRLIQVQNLPQNKFEDLALARETLRSGEFDTLEMLFGAPPFVLSQLIRTAFIPSEGSRFIVSDFSAIEARVIAWLADEEWVLDVFRGHGKIYEATAAQMFGVAIETIKKGHANYALRAKGKVATLACGYQGGPNALIAMGALKGGIAEDELPALVKQWREANPNIVSLWYEAERAAVAAVSQKTTVKLKHGVQYRYSGGVLFADLPSGRSLAYWNPRLEPGNFGKEVIAFDGMDQMKKLWCKQTTYGGKLVENLVQAIARDCLAESMQVLDVAGYKIAIHVHDEVVLDVPNGFGSVEKVAKLMGAELWWAPGLPLTSDGYECEFYRKD
jgi:DNA polymerase